MAKCGKIRELERVFDSGDGDLGALGEHVALCQVCSSHLASLRVMREAAHAATAKEAVSDMQFPAFMRGIHDRLESEQTRYMGPTHWAFASIATAALIVAVSLLVIFSGGPSEVSATAIESYSTDVEGATVTTYSSENGTATVWLNVPQGDMW